MRVKRDNVYGTVAAHAPKGSSVKHVRVSRQDNKGDNVGVALVIPPRAGGIRDIYLVCKDSRRGMAKCICIKSFSDPDGCVVIEKVTQTEEDIIIHTKAILRVRKTNIQNLR